MATVVAMEPVEIKSGPAEVIASGTVIAFEGNPVEITCGPPGERLRLILVFKDEEGREDLRVEGDILDSNTMKLTFFNFKDPLGSGSTRPIPVGILEYRRLYIQYRVYGFSGGDKTIHYTIYRGEEVAVNE